MERAVGNVANKGFSHTTSRTRARAPWRCSTESGVDSRARGPPGVTGTPRGACDRGGHDLPYRARKLGRGVQDVHAAEGRGGTARVKERWRLWERPDACEHRKPGAGRKQPSPAHRESNRAGRGK